MHAGQNDEAMQWVHKLCQLETAVLPSCSAACISADTSHFGTGSVRVDIQATSVMLGSITRFNHVDKQAAHTSNTNAVLW